MQTQGSQYNLLIAQVMPTTFFMMTPLTEFIFQREKVILIYSIQIQPWQNSKIKLKQLKVQERRYSCLQKKNYCSQCLHIAVTPRYGFIQPANDFCKKFAAF